MGSQVSELLSISAPCFSCQYCYNCKYWRNILWCDWILKNAECPVGKYSFESLAEALWLKEEEEKKKRERQNVPPQNGFFRPS